jgi:RNase H-fold protein (predicted Holliday junction resolvase)
MIYLGFDPGKDKCGVAVVDHTGKALYHEVWLSAELVTDLPALCAQWQISQIVMGDRTTARQWQQKLTAALPEMLIYLVDEHYSTLAARDLYWEMYPPQGLQRLVPQGMRLPPRPIDDLVAIILVRRYLQLSA